MAQQEERRGRKGPILAILAAVGAFIVALFWRRRRRSGE